ncbi:MAG: LysM peptidoglycan-binding domain-containing protein [Elusimicrobia bacterium]|nr:LysM peptidoglycan-binding domain-containing protein [Elusimicrobiota bacterium]
MPAATEQATLADVRRLKTGLSDAAPAVPAAPAAPPPGAAAPPAPPLPPRLRRAPAPPTPEPKTEPARAAKPAAPSEETERLKRRVEALERKLAPQAPRAVTNIYEVVPGDTLQSISQKLWGDASRWTELYRANADRVQRGGYVEPGQRLVVPQGMP